MAKQDIQEAKELGKFEGLVMEKLENIEAFIKGHDEKESEKNQAFDNRITCVEKKQEKFAWYIGVAVGVGVAIMFVVDKIYEFYQRTK